MAPSKNKTNPAKRLLAILHEAESSKAVVTLDVWKEVLRAESEITTVLRLEWLDRQFEETERQIRRIDDIDHAYYLEGVTSLRKITSAKNFTRPWSEVKIAHLGGVPLRNLGFCSRELDRRGGEFKIEDETLKTLQKDVEALLNEMLEADLPISLRDFIVRQLQTIKNAIVEYRLGGVAALEQALESVVGALILRKPELLRNKDKPGVKRLFQIVGKAFHVLQAVQTLLALEGDAEKIIKLLTESGQ